jgi:hypothetical protein
MDDRDLILLSLSVIAFGCASLVKQKLLRNRAIHQQKRRTKWVKEILLKRNSEGTDAILIPKLLSDSANYRNYFRMSKETFGVLLTALEPDLVRSNTVMRKSITASERLAVALRFLATGNYNNYSYVLMH